MYAPSGSRARAPRRIMGETHTVFEQTFKNIDDVLWKEAGCTTELDYTEQTSWMLFLKYLDDLEQERAMEAELVGKPYDFIIDEPHRWSSWAAPKKADGTFDHDKALTGDDLIDLRQRRAVPLPAGLQAARQRPRHHRVQDRRDLRRDQEQVPERLQPARRPGTGRRPALPLPEGKARAVPPLRSQDQEHGQRRAQRRRVLHAAPADPRHDPGRQAEDRRAHL